jgi:hypothetical protein
MVGKLRACILYQINPSLLSAASAYIMHVLPTSVQAEIEARSISCGAGASAAGGVAASQTDELTFLRGLVMTDVNGLATFETIFPGRYTGRTPHIHAKVHALNLLYLLYH